MQSIRNTINKIFSRLEYEKSKNRMNLTATLYANLRLLPFKTALRFPIAVYGKINFISLSGEVIFNSVPSEIGALKIGISDAVRSISDHSNIRIDGKVFVKGKATIRRGLKLCVFKDAKLVLDENCYIGDNVSIQCANSITIGESVRVANNTSFMDTDFHYLLNIESREVKNCLSEIFIAKGCWIGSWVVVKKNTRIPEFTIVAGPYSMLSKDYTKSLEPFSIIGGVPAKAITSGYLRISRTTLEKEIKEFYCRENCKTFSLSDSLDLLDVVLEKKMND